MNKFTFTSGDKRRLTAIANEFGLIEATTKGQKKNGTISYVDPITVSVYTLYESGYIRRANHGARASGIFYQLNPKHENGDHVTRVMLNPLEQIGQLVSSIIACRKTKSVKP